MKTINSLKKLFLIPIIMLGFGLITPISASAEDVCSANVPEEVKDAAGCSGNKNALPDVVMGIVNAIFIIIAIVALIAIIISGVQYMTSTGDPAKAKKAKDTLLHAIIGLAIVILAAAIVNLIIRIVTTPPQ